MKIPNEQLKNAFLGLRQRHPEVTGVAIGKREKRGQYQIDKEDVFIINVNKKLRFPQWSGRRPLPKRIWGIPTDIQENMDIELSAKRPHLNTSYIVSGNYGGSMGLYIDHKHYGVVGVTNRHVAKLAPNDEWCHIDNKDKPFCKVLVIAEKNVDAALMQLIPYESNSDAPQLTAHHHVQWAEPQIGQTAYYLGGRTNREQAGKVKVGTVLQKGIGMTDDPSEPEGVFTTTNFGVLNLMGDTCAPIPGDSGTPIFCDIYGKPFCLGVVYAQGDRNQFCKCVPITDIINEFKDVTFGEAPIFNLPGYVRLEEYESLMDTKNNLYNMYQRYAQAAVANQKTINKKNIYIKQLETKIKNL